MDKNKFREGKPLTIALASESFADGVVDGNGYYSKDFRIITADTLITDSHGIVMSIPTDVLKSAMPLFENKLVHLEHDTTLSNWIGKINNPVWQEITPERPAGINATVSVSYERDEILKAGVIKAMKEGLIRNGSLGFSVAWVKSHPDMKDSLFWEMMGKEVDGVVVHFIITKITTIFEYSLCHAGADPYATALSAKEEGLLMGLIHKMQEKLNISENKPKPVEVTIMPETTAQNAAFEAALKDKVNLEAALKEQTEKTAKAELALQERIKTERKGKFEAALKALTEEGKLAANDATGLAEMLSDVDPVIAEKMLAALTNAPAFKPAEPAKPLEKASESLSDKDYAEFAQSDEGKAFSKTIKMSIEKARERFPEQTMTAVKSFKGVI